MFGWCGRIEVTDLLPGTAVGGEPGDIAPEGLAGQSGAHVIHRRRSWEK